MNRRKCLRCGLVNSGDDETCRRCGDTLSEQVATVERPGRRPRLIHRLMLIVGATSVILTIIYASLLVSSDGLKPDQQRAVDTAIQVLVNTQFNREVFALKHLAHFRSTDNWWNKYIGHRDAYAATNFPFEVITLYPEFFSNTSDDNERAAVLLHEAQHLLGAGEERALKEVWLNKYRIRWSEDIYGQSRVWSNTRDLTRSMVPELFTCGADKNSDCAK